jgi:hypothetical protein
VQSVNKVRNRFFAYLKTWARRTVTIPLTLAVCLGMMLLLPVNLLFAFVVDLIRRKQFVLSRSVLFFTFYFYCEVGGIVGSLFLWITNLFRRNAESYLNWNFALQRWWANALAQGTQKLFNFTMKVEGADELTRGPVLVFARHASVADTLLPAFFIANPNGIRLRYVLKHQLLLDPCLDIVGNRLPNVFVHRDAGEAHLVNRLMHNLTSRDGVMIFPEGTRFTIAKREKILARIKEKGEIRLYEKASQLQHTLPPRLGGALNLLEKNEQADVIFCAHAGFDGVVDLRDFLNGKMIGRTVRVRFWRVPFQQIPLQREERVDWLLANWRQMDEWVGRELSKEPAKKSV